jgi:hypothetical protein
LSRKFPDDDRQLILSENDLKRPVAVRTGHEREVIRRETVNEQRYRILASTSPCSIYRFRAASAGRAINKLNYEFFE